MQEYLFGDFGKIGLVLGAGFFEKGGKQPEEETDLFAEFGDYSISDFGSQPLYRLLDVTKMGADEFREAIRTLLPSQPMLRPSPTALR